MAGRAGEREAYIQSQGPIYDELSGAHYYIINGQTVWARSERRVKNGSSNAGEVTPSVLSRFESTRFASKPALLSPSTWPPTIGPSPAKTKLQGTLPPSKYGGISGNASCASYQVSEASAPAGTTIVGAADIYRQSLDPSIAPHGPPLRCKFVRDSNAYHDLDDAADAALRQYKDFLTTSKGTKALAKKYPGVYAGMPLETYEWHQQAAKLALNTERIFAAAIEARGQMGQDFVGYDSQRGAKGHSKRVEKLESGRKYARQKFDAHATCHDAVQAGPSRG